MDMKERIANRKRNKCRHFTGTMNDTCAAGVPYINIEVKAPHGGHDLPCFNEPGTHCRLQSLLTEEEWAQKEIDSKRFVEELGRKIEERICLTCGQQYTPQQVGRCVYAKECGHRQYQGRV